MARTKTFQVINNRFLLRCDACGSKRRLFVAPHLKQKNIRCPKCGEINKCAFNRRITPRTLQTGKAVLTTRSGKEIDVHLTDVSSKGFGIELSFRDLHARVIKEGDQVQLVCNWNPALTRGSQFIVQNIREQRVGIKRIIPGEML